MMYAVPHYYHSSQTAYGERKALVKQEPIDLFDAGTPMDICHIDSESNGSFHIPSDHDSISCENVHNPMFERSYVPNHHHYSEHPKSHSVAKQRITYAQNPSFEDLSTPTSEVEEFQPGTRISGVPEILTKSGRNFDPDTVDLSIIAAHHRARREFVPDNKKDNSYWSKRLKNNDSARRSRVKRKALEKILETRLMELEKENLELKHEVASLRRRYGEENESPSNAPTSSIERTTLNTKTLPCTSQENAQTEVVELDSASGVFNPCDNSHQTSDAYTATTTNPKLGTLGGDMIDSIDNNSRINIKTLSNSQSYSCSLSDGSAIALLQTDLTGALDLTVDNSNRSTPTWESSSSESDNCCFRRYSFISSESSSQEDNNNIKVFPLKCRWKKEMHASYMTVPGRLK